MTKLWKTRVFKFSVAALALGSIGLFTPRAAHALAATLVQVTNTAANPAIAQSPNTQAAQLVELTSYIPSNATSTFYSLSGNGTGTPNYTVPAGQSLVITSVDFYPSGNVTAYGPCQTNGYIQLLRNSSLNGPFWITPAGAPPTHYDYPSGIVIAPGLQPSAQYGNAIVTTCSVQMLAHGYLTAN